MNTDGRGALVLVVDDHNDNLRFIGELLDRAGYQVMPALDGAAALARAAKRPPALALLDMSMPGMDGIETCRRLRQLPDLQDLPVLFVTAATDHASLSMAFSAGAVDYITKPFVADELLMRVRNHLDLRQARARLETMLREREEMTDIIAHDLKNPLTCILFAAQSQRRAANARQCGELAEEILGCADEALRYIQRFLVRGEQAQRLRPFTRQPVPLATIAAEAVRLQRLAAAHQQVKIGIVGHAVVQADPRVARDVIQNLVSNAIRHSPADSEIRIELSAGRPGYAVCAVMDRGRGVDESIRERLFERYVRYPADDAVAGDGYSSGLGLAIARNDIGQMGGRLWYAPRDGGGSVFAFELPEPAADPAVATAAPLRDDGDTA